MLSAVALTACSSDEPLPAPAPVPDADGVAASRSVSDAEAIAIALAEGRQGESRFGEQVFVDGVVALTESNSRSGSDTLLYAVNYAGNKGFVLVAAPLAAEPIIGFTEQGSFDEAKAAENPAFSFYLDAAKSYAASKVGIGGTVIPDPSHPIETLQLIPFKIWTEWGRSFPEGKFCPNGNAGCTQVAMAQMMTYLEKPTSMQYTYAGRDINSENLNWEALSRHAKSITLDRYSSIYAEQAHIEECAADEAAHNTIARVCRQLGELNHAEYFETGKRGTTATIEAANRTFNSLLPTNEVSVIKQFAASDYESIFNYMVHNDVVLMLEGKDSSNNKHIWVCDGGERITVTQKVILAGGETIEVEISRKTYFRFNWGWCGAENGNFLAGVFNSPIISTTESHGTFDQNVRYFSVHK